ncbi:cysteine-rich secretory protein LCCL domain-containing 2-like [Hyperolius riggenbachi]|uniref:cysteine-rich secretory protein LCCL domain-containing 2-like n=1 Tax=Hyperolius riggenbachi TaxID=752182 RepID=UPI0035A26CAC
MNGRTVWGTGVYTDDSSVCKAAIHAGVLDNKGGLAMVEITPGQASYNGSTRNEVTTSSYGPWSGSFVLHRTSGPATPNSTTPPFQNPPVPGTCSTTARILYDSNPVVQCPADCLLNGSAVWGTGVYKDDSSICRAAIHEGIIGIKGGLVRLKKIPGQVNYSGYSKNGITTYSYGVWSGSFVFKIHL